jgi:hypothetical protein
MERMGSCRSATAEVQRRALMQATLVAPHAAECNHVLELFLFNMKGLHFAPNIEQ